MLIPSQAIRKLIESVETKKSKLRIKRVKGTCFFYWPVALENYRKGGQA